MKFKNSLLICCLVSLASCQLFTNPDYELPPYDGDFLWTRVSKHAAWSNRLDHAVVVYQEKIWVIGGYNPGQVSGDTYYEDVWSSPDGINWTEVCSEAPWNGRRGHTVTVFDDGTGEALFIIGGFSVDQSTGYRQYNNDVWKSGDGANWALIKERTYPKYNAEDDWFPRMNHSVISKESDGTNYLYLIGGSSMLEGYPARYSMRYFNDVWRSADGITWVDLHCNDYGIRSGHAVAMDPSNGRIYLQGGLYGVIFEAINNENQPIPNWQWLWCSDDCINWTAISPPVSFNQAYLYRGEHQMSFYNNTLYVFPGRTNYPQYLQFAELNSRTIWKREINNEWSEDSNGSDSDPRYSYGLVNFNGKLWILGGETDTNGPSNDVWNAEIK